MSIYAHSLSSTNTLVTESTHVCFSFCFVGKKAENRPKSSVKSQVSGILSSGFAALPSFLPFPQLLLHEGATAYCVLSSVGPTQVGGIVPALQKLPDSGGERKPAPVKQSESNEVWNYVAQSASSKETAREGWKRQRGLQKRLDLQLYLETRVRGRVRQREGSPEEKLKLRMSKSTHCSEMQSRFPSFLTSHQLLPRAVLHANLSLHLLSCAQNAVCWGILYMCEEASQMALSPARLPWPAPPLVLRQSWGVPPLPSLQEHLLKLVSGTWQAFGK